MTMTRDQIREVFMQHGFTIKEGQTDLKPYVYEAAESLLALAERALEPQTDLQKLYQTNLAKSEKLLASWPLPAKKPVAYMAQHVSGSWNPLLVADDEDDGIELAEGWSYQPVYAATSSVLEPQGQALPELPPPAYKQQYVCTKCGATGKGTGAAHNRLDGSPCSYMASHHGPWFTADQMRAYGRKCASQLALPAGPTDDEIREAVEYITELHGYDIRDEHDDMWTKALVISVVRHLQDSPAVAQPVADEREAFELDYAKAWHEASVVARNHSIEHLCDELKEMRVGATYGEGNDYLNFKWEGWQARAALCQPAEEKAPHEWSTLRRGYFDVFNDDGTVYATVFNSLEALSYLENGWRVEEQKSGQPAEEGDKA